MPVPTKNEISDYDVQIIITRVMEEFQNMANPTTDVFQAVYRSSVRCYLRGRKIGCPYRLLAEVMSLVTDNAKHMEQYAAFCHWVKRVHEDAVPRRCLTGAKTGLGANAAMLTAGMGCCGVAARSVQKGRHDSGEGSGGLGFALLTFSGFAMFVSPILVGGLCDISGSFIPSLAIAAAA